MTAEPVAQTPAVSEELERRADDVMRVLSIDAVQKANSGHPGTPMALAPLAHVLFTRILRYDAADAEWPDRDRFVLSAGHASMLLYSMLYLTGYGLELDDLKQFRQLGSRTAGHPERGHAAGIAVDDRPTLLILRSHIGYPSPKYTDTAHAHGNALGADEVAKVKEILGMPPEDFWVPEDVLEYYRQAGARGRGARDAWRERV